MTTKTDFEFLDVRHRKLWKEKSKDYPFAALGPAGVVPVTDFESERYGEVIGVVLARGYERLWGFQTAEFRDKFVEEIKGAKVA